jgi:hypothetical protein
MMILRLPAQWVFFFHGLWLGILWQGSIEGVPCISAGEDARNQFGRG